MSSWHTSIVLRYKWTLEQSHLNCSCAPTLYTPTSIWVYINNYSNIEHTLLVYNTRIHVIYVQYLFTHSTYYSLHLYRIHSQISTPPPLTHTQTIHALRISIHTQIHIRQKYILIAGFHTPTQVKSVNVFLASECFAARIYVFSPVPSPCHASWTDFLSFVFVVASSAFCFLTGFGLCLYIIYMLYLFACVLCVLNLYLENICIANWVHCKLYKYALPQLKLYLQ